MLLELCTFVLNLWGTGIGKRHACHLRVLDWNVSRGGCACRATCSGCGSFAQTVCLTNLVRS